MVDYESIGSKNSNKISTQIDGTDPRLGKCGGRIRVASSTKHPTVDFSNSKVRSRS